nr:phospho-sugar mutase [Bacteroidales bacterium]
EGAEQIKKIMCDYRNNPPLVINNSKVILIKDFLLQKEIDLVADKTQKTDLPVSDVIQFLLEDGSKITIRPSGTEPKIKYYFSVNAPVSDTSAFTSIDQLLAIRIDNIVKDLKIL